MDKDRLSQEMEIWMVPQHFNMLNLTHNQEKI